MGGSDHLPRHFPMCAIPRESQFISPNTTGITVNPGPERALFYASQAWPGSEYHSPSSAKDGGAVHCPLSQGICMLKRIITSAKGKAAPHRLSGLSRKGRVCQYEERLPRNTDVTHGGQAAHSGFRLIWTWKGGWKPSARGESSKPELSSHQGLLSCSLSPGLASLSSLQVWTCFLPSSQV